MNPRNSISADFVRKVWTTVLRITTVIIHVRCHQKSLLKSTCEIANNRLWRPGSMVIGRSSISSQLLHVPAASASVKEIGAIKQCHEYGGRISTGFNDSKKRFYNVQLLLSRNVTIQTPCRLAQADGEETRTQMHIPHTVHKEN
eukprot:scaffold15425_cov93-Cylindrotheca_fusiformis.AAC.1